MKKDWEIMRLGEVCEIKNGGTPKTGSEEYWDGDVRWITPKDLGKLKSKYVDDTPRTISKLGLQKSSAKLIPSNSIILSTRAPIGHIAINTKEMATNQGCRGIIPSNKIIEEYLYHFLSNSVKLLNELGTGATFKELSTKALASVNIPIPPLPEQKRIVSILDRAFEAIAKAKANAEQNLKNAKELFESYLQGVFENKGEDWEENSIQGVCDKIFAGGDAPKDNFSKARNDKYKIPIFANAVKKRGLYGFTDVARVTEPCVTISARGSGTGHTEIRIEPFLPIVRLIVLIPNIKLINYEFLKHTVDNLEILRSGSAIPQLTVPMMKQYKISLPPIKEQKQIVQKLDNLSTEAKKLEAVYQQKIDDLEELKKSILQKAFNGEL